MSGLPCVNCGKEVPADKAKLFAEVFLCEGCHQCAVHFFERLTRELNGLLVFAKESIRIALVEGNFSFPEGPSGEPSKREVLEEILKMDEARSKRPCDTDTPTQLSTESTSPHVRTLAALGRGGSPKGSPRG